MYETIRIIIWSHFRNQTWTGDVVVDTERDVNEQIFRMFNRVDEADADRLELWDYYLPSLSVNDQITHVTKWWRRNRTYRVCAVGFERV